ncbi:hypothetical protein [Fluviicola taffensis]|uniref:Lipoprotein n=1 Tax=Fluviicola taffensis (strain DSM 16823 / NCIMB 13979 / RW262) TaxID=755732 RepID=F2IG15_FLUTR|nr:hypothetical protein [Fluviicola taffensis]AEA43636.1 hypothetical protein Fluta_1644 [Fluviicola taffensis DSM 16823]
MRFVFNIIGIFLALTSCTKLGKNVYVDGYVRNAITGEPVPNVSLRLYRGQVSWGDPVGTASKTLKEVTTDANGYYKAEHLSTPFNTVYIQLGKGVEGGYILVEGQTPTVIKKGKKKHVDFGVVPYGYLKQTIKNTSCFNQSDTLFFNRKYQISNISNISDVDVIYSGCVDFNSGYYKFPMGWYYISGYYKKNNVVTAFSDSIYITEGGYHEWVFEY